MGPCTPNPCTSANKNVCSVAGGAAHCACNAGYSDQGGACVKICAPSCAGKTCGSDGCGGTCGACGAGQLCSATGTCNVCTPSCAGKTCGPDGCGGSCGFCGVGVCNGARTRAHSSLRRQELRRRRLRRNLRSVLARQDVRGRSLHRPELLLGRSLLRGVLGGRLLRVERLLRARRRASQLVLPEHVRQVRRRLPGRWRLLRTAQLLRQRLPVTVGARRIARQRERCCGW
jgi:hypothetical protein